MGKPFVKKFTDEVFLAEFYFLICKRKKAEDWVFRKTKVKTEFKGEGAFQAFKTKKGSGEIFIIWMLEWDEDALLHELTHASIYIFHDRGVFISKKHDEAFCYYLSYLFKKAKELYGK
jgi:hypothetical protein